MAFNVTKNHETIVTWVEARGGKPALAQETRSENSDGMLELKFGDSGPGLEIISWEEFFDIFESNKMAFRYPDETIEKEQGLAYSFIDRDKTSAQTDDETELPEDNEMAIENTYGSAPSNESPISTDSEDIETM